jgi:hypothetical protein
LLPTPPPLGIVLGARVPIILMPGHKSAEVPQRPQWRTRMRNLVISYALVVSGATAYAQTPTAADKGPVEVKATGTPGQATAVRTIRITATIKALDVAGRTVTLQTKEGETKTFKVGPGIKRLDEFAVGDVIVIDYQQGLALEFQPAGTATVPATAGAVAGRNTADQAPGGAAAAGVQATVTVTAIDTAKRLVSFQGPGGNIYQVKAGPKIKLEKLKVGDRLLATYVESVAIQLEKPKK